ncbi:T9SS type A sorting domain-containing protein [Flavobacterium sp. F372]|uniref:Choice-of-anchor J domain-containing protein n=1 Tax=Flavobacterium bernardetii TaxID=2813823 RepID=A0ABR7IWR5_9FLAO|nr:choice-of-anchor J domain-containing protein [Flavobacterium bernardetii]MBC5834224.1 choice-of-anchor J domain-containing protein [Flavobacterium bernardetii]NHF70137.1 T9SS type A sorting domain-containing protein [Flavobacterium bernardetii]
MKKITLWLFALFTCWQMTAQTGTIVVGVNDGTPNTTTGYPSPMQDYYKTGRVQFLYTASELLGAGLVAGNITEIGWVVTSNNTSTLQENYTISMKSTASTVLTTTFESGATVVYGPTDFTPSATGNVMFTLTTPFVWDGTSNVIVEVCAGLATGTFTENVSCANSTTTGIKSVYFRSDSATTPCTTATGTTSTDRPLLVATGNVASCLAPLNLVSANITAFTADISWDATSSTPLIGYEYVVSTSNVAPTGAGTPTTNTFASLSSLLPQTTYYVFVRSNCTVSDFSAWNGPISFTTACAPITTLPHLEPFNTFLPICWTEADNGDLTAGPATIGTGSWLVDGLGNVGTTGAIRVTLDGAIDNDWVVSPEFTIPATGYELKFTAAATQGGLTVAPTTAWESDDSVEVLVTSTGMTNWVPLYTYIDTNVPSNVGSLNVLDLDAYATQTVRFAFRAVEGAANGAAVVDFSVDNLEVRLSPTCPDQTGLVVSGVTSTGANTSWDDMSGTGAVGYQYAITTSATPPASGTPIATTFYIASGLLPQTVYYLHVRSECAGSIFGNWATTSFTTACSPIVALPWNEGFETVATGTNIFPQCWGYSNTLSDWNIETFPVANTGVNSLGRTWSTNGWAFTPMFTLTAGTSYRFSYYVRTQDAIVGYDVTVGVGNSQNSAAMTTTVSTVTAYQGPAWVKVNHEFTPLTNGDYSFGVHVVAPGAPNGINFDDFKLELSPTCPDQTGLVVANITSSGADTSWDDMSGSGAVGYQYAITTSATPPASGTPIAATFYIASGLLPQTVYYLHVRSECAGSTYGNWATTTFTTACVPVGTLPWNEGFETVATGTNIFPQCWGYSNTLSDWNIETFPVANTGVNSLGRTWSTNGWAFTPMFTLAAGTSYTFSYYVRTQDATVGYDVTVGVGNSQSSAAMTTTLSTVTGYQGPTWTQVFLNFTPTVAGDYSFGVHVVAPNPPNGINFDDFELKLSPSIPPACAANLVATPNACGNFSNNLNWDATATATGYYVTIGTTTGGTDIANAVSVGTNAYSFSGSVNTQYFWTIVPYNGAGSATGCVEQSFTTAATGCYCASVPSSNDNLGITSAIVGATTNPISDVTYVDLTAVAEVVAPGANTNVQLTFSTGYTYDINIWIDFNNDFDFDDAGELVKTGIACTAVEPNIVDASFTMPLTAPSGTHRMRIGTADSGQAPPNPCYNGNFGVTLDFTVDTTLGSASFDTTSFVAYPNPVKDVLNLSYKTAINNVRVVNLLGQEVLNSRTNSNDIQVNMSALTAGAYIVNITVEDTVHTIKIIKE